MAMLTCISMSVKAAAYIAEYKDWLGAPGTRTVWNHNGLTLYGASAHHG